MLRVVVAAELERLVRHRPRARKRTNHVQLLPIAVRTIALLVIVLRAARQRMNLVPTLPTVARTIARTHIVNRHPTQAARCRIVIVTTISTVVRINAPTTCAIAVREATRARPAVLAAKKMASAWNSRCLAVEAWCAKLLQDQLSGRAREVKQRRETGNRAKTPLNAFR